MKVLLIKTSSLGDLVHTLPAVTDAQNKIPNIKFDWIAEETFAEVPSWHTAIEQVIPIALRRWRKNILSVATIQEIILFIKKIRAKQYDLIIDAQGLLKSAIITTASKGTSYGYDKNSIREPLASYFYNKTFTISKKLHAITRIRQLFADVLNYDEPNTNPNYNINISAPSPINNDEKYVVFLHGTSNEKKCWPAQQWVDLAQLITSEGINVYLPWGNKLEENRAHLIAQDNKKIKVLPKLQLSAIATILQNAQGVIAVDTGLGHVSAALGKPTISLYGPTNPQLIGIIGTNTIHLTNFEKLEATDVWHKAKNIL